METRISRQELTDWQSAYAEQRAHLERARILLATAEQSSRYEKTAKEVAEKLLEKEQNNTRDIVAFLDTLGFPRASSSSSESVSIGTLWADNRAQS